MDRRPLDLLRPRRRLSSAMTARCITSPLLTLAINLCALDIRLRNIIVFASVGCDLLLKETVMQQLRGFSLGAVALAIVATVMLAAVAPSSAIAGTSAHARIARHHKATHFTAQRAHDGNYRRYRAYGAGPAGAYGAILGGGSGFASPSYPGFGYGYGDNSYSYTN
jgi:hypothetical protein